MSYRIMTQENIELLIKDLCARLPFNNHLVEYKDEKYNVLGIAHGRLVLCKPFMSYTLNEHPLVEDVKPYLFPLSSITDEQERELSKLGVSYGEYALHDDIRGLGIMVDEAYIFFEFCYKHHIDFLGLIEKGLAIDARGLNIY